MMRIGTHETDRISRTRELVRPTGLERRKVGRLDPERRGDIGKIEPQRLPLLPQHIPGRPRTRWRNRWIFESFFHEGRFEPQEQRLVPTPLPRHASRKPVICPTRAGCPVQREFTPSGRYSAMSWSRA